MSEDREQRIRERAHALWEADGHHAGREQEYWLRAEQLIAAEDDEGAPDMVKTPPL
jgi:hypothetical protein